MHQSWTVICIVSYKCFRMEMELLGGPQTRVRSRNLSLFQESGYRVQDYSYEGIIGKIKSESMS